MLEVQRTKVKRLVTFHQEDQEVDWFVNFSAFGHIASICDMCNFMSLSFSLSR